jgi:ribonuclease HI
MADADVLHSMELALARRTPERLPGGYAAVLHDAFVEVGSSGRTWTRAELLEALEGARPTDAIDIDDFDVEEVCAGVRLVRFTTTGTQRDGTVVRSRRASLWVREGATWRMRYHQGTPVPPENR